MAATGWYKVKAGDTIAASHLNISIDQSVLAFASASARTTGLAQATPHVGMTTYLQDVRRLEVWDGAAWVPMSGGANKLDDLTDVDVSTTPAVSGDSIVYNASTLMWLPGAPISQGLTVMAAVRAVTTANITLSGLQTIDGVTLVAGDRVLVKEQTNKVQNGIYTASATAWARATDANTEGSIGPGSAVFSNEGATFGTISFIAGVPSSAIPWTPGVDINYWMIFTSKLDIQAGAGLSAVGRVVNVGAGTGVTVGADTVGVDTTVIATKAYVDGKISGTISMGLAASAPSTGTANSLYFGWIS